jgi:putative flippase GtrA
MVTSEFIAYKPISIGLSAWLTMSWNFIWDRKYAFWNAHNHSFIGQYFGFVLICSIPVLTNYFVTLHLSNENAISISAIAGAGVGSAVGIVFNFFMTKIFVFKK